MVLTNKNHKEILQMVELNLGVAVELFKDFQKDIAKLGE